ncbi:MAG: hypothetical protein JEZ06_21205 [Anaerolineaceae bacterium]|nr:hypothetical protein [Anaerolineaceae bacterium]
MKKKIFYLALILLILGFRELPKKLSSEIPAVYSPRSGDVLKGSVIIDGNSEVDGFTNIEIAYSYDNQDDEQSWFMIFHGDEMVSDGTLAIWDTTLITDGDYELRVRFKFEERDDFDIFIRNLKVRNYSIVESVEEIETAQEVEIRTEPTPGKSDTVAMNDKIVFTKNPASITVEAYMMKIFQGVGLTGIGLLVLLVYYSIRSSSKK